MNLGCYFCFLLICFFMMKKLILFVSLVLFVFVANPVYAGKRSPTPTPTPVPIPKSICIDAGHGGTETGTSNLDLLEKNVNLEVALLLRDKLINEAGYINDANLFMTRETDITFVTPKTLPFLSLFIITAQPIPKQIIHWAFI